jgi:hypothetical protein
MGEGFVNFSSGTDSVTPSFAAPVLDPTVGSVVPTLALTRFSTIDFQFDQPMDTASFSIADDVMSFTGPGAVDLLPTISGFSWISSTLLRLNL